ncbi:hypothetical protein Tco_0378721 [Tanacetum coccineum]
MAEDGKLKIDSMIVMISISVRCRLKTLYIKRSFRSLWQKPNLQISVGRHLSEDIRRKTSREYTNYLLSADEDRGRGYDKGQEAEQKQVEIMKDRRDKEVNMTARDSDDALVCYVKNAVEDRIMDSGASFHATYCKEELERFKLRFGKVCLADDKTLDITGVGDVVLKTSFGTSWTLKDVSLVVARENKRGSLYMVEVHPEGIDAVIDASGSAALWFGEVAECQRRQGNCRGWSKFIQKAMALHLLHQSENPATMILLSKTVAELRSATDSCSLTKPIQKSQVVLVDIPENLTENDSIVAEHGLSSEITQSPDGAFSEEEGSETPRNPYSGKKAINEEMVSLERRHHKNYGCLRLKKSISKRYKEPSYVGALNNTSTEHKRRGFSANWAERKPRVQTKGNFVRIKASTETMMKDRCSEKHMLGYVFTVGVTTVEWESRLQKSITVLTIEAYFMAILGTKSFAEMFTRLVMKEKLKLCASSTDLRRVPYVRRYRKVRAVALFKGRKVRAIVKGKVVRSLQRLLETESSEVISLQVGDC